jgi:predicted Zn finger-like uncharacterized protein
MIVICTKCHAKFRMADERVGPRGAKVRCSRCKAVFVVAGREPEVQRPPPLPPPLPQASSAPALRPPGGEAAAALAADHVAGPDAADPFAGLGEDPFAPSSRSPDPFQTEGFTPLPRPAADPFAAAADPFATAGTTDPFEARATRGALAEGPYEFGARLPVTDLGDLLGPATPAPFPASPAPAAAPSAAAGLAALDHGLDGLALEDRTTPSPSPLLRGADGGIAGLDELSQAGPPGLDPDAFDFGGAAEDDLALGGEPDRAPLRAPVPRLAELGAHAREEPPSPPRREAWPRSPAVGARDGAATAAPSPAAPAGGRATGARGSRLRAAAVNAAALAALLVAALAFLVVWRSDGPLDASAFRPLAIVGTLRTAAPGPFAAQAIRSGLYEREKGPPLLFVRGEVVSRAPAPVAAVQVDVEIVREGRVIARGGAMAGAVPTPEELHRARDASALAALARASAARAPPQVRPGDTVPFLVTIGDHPADLSGAALRIALAGSEASVR